MNIEYIETNEKRRLKDMSEYDEHDQAYQDLLEEANACREQNDTMKELITQICDLIHYQANLKHQDAWLAEVIEMGLYNTEEE